MHTILSFIRSRPHLQLLAVLLAMVAGSALIWRSLSFRGPIDEVTILLCALAGMSLIFSTLGLVSNPDEGQLWTDDQYFATPQPIRVEHSDPHRRRRYAA